MILQCEGLGRSYGDTKAVSDVSFTLAEGKSLALIGRNGAGKTTTLGMLTTLVRPDKGRATVLGADILREPERVRAGLGVLFQEPALDSRISPRETLRLHAAMHALSWRDSRERVAEALSWAGLDHVAGRPAGSFSGGMKRRLELARALMHRPRLLILDEPTLGLDPQGRRDLWARIDGLRQSGLAVLLTTHVLTEADRCDRVGVLDEGRIIALDTPEALKHGTTGRADASLEDVFVSLTGQSLNSAEALASRPAKGMRP